MTRRACAARPAITAGSVTFSSTLMPSSRLKNWNTMPMWRAAHDRELVLASCPTSDSPASDDLAVGRRVEPGDEVEQRRLAATRRPHHRDELAGRHREVDAAQRAHRARLRTRTFLRRPRVDEDRALVGHGAPRCSSRHRSPPSDCRHVDAERAHRRLPALDHLLAERLAPRASACSAACVASLITMQPAGRARSWSRCARFTVSPTSVYSSRSSDPSSAAATGPVERPMPRPNGGMLAAGPRARSSARCALEHRDRGRDTRGRRGPRAATGAPKHAITASPTNCITVPPSSRIAWFISARCSLSWCASCVGSLRLGDARVAADVAT